MWMLAFTVTLTLAILALVTNTVSKVTCYCSVWHWSWSLTDLQLKYNCYFGVVKCTVLNTHTHTHTRFYVPQDFVRDYPGELVPEPIWILLKQETASGSDISWAICKSAPCPWEITTPASHHSGLTGWVSFLPPNQQRQSTEGYVLIHSYYEKYRKCVLLSSKVIFVQ